MRRAEFEYSLVKKDVGVAYGIWAVAGVFEQVRRGGDLFTVELVLKNPFTPIVVSFENKRAGYLSANAVPAEVAARRLHLQNLFVYAGQPTSVFSVSRMR